MTNMYDWMMNIIGESSVEQLEEDEIAQRYSRTKHGFVYKITCIDTGQFYIGCKKFNRKITRKPLKGRKNKRREFVESDWRNYWGSSNELQALVQKHGKDAFIREIIDLCDGQWELKYQELKHQLAYDVLFNPLALNGIINVRLNRPKVKK